ncbi:MAG: Lytic transglycosylase catalytic [Frankiales bacterium]|nr:Lytic transglycosylase catalytic [Frankiales bacterium]
MRLRRTAAALALALTAGAGATAAVVLHPAASAHRSTPHAAVAPPAVQVAASRSRTLPTVVPRVAPLRTLRTPDLLVTVRRPLTAKQLTRLRAIRGMQGVTVLDIGTVHLATGKGLRIAGVDPSQFRQFTPRETATSDPLWQTVARGELAPSYGVLHVRHLTLGGTVAVQGLRRLDQRIGAVAAFGVPGVDVVTSRLTARAFGVVPASGVLLNAPDRSISRLQTAVRDAVGAAASIDVLRPQEITVHRKASTYRELYIESARYCPGLPWQVLAAIGQVESGHGRNVGPSSAGALGPMQFMPATWAYSGVDGDGDGKADIMNPYDAVPAAALYLCRAGAANGQQGLYDAIFSYNHADWYVKEVLGLAARYR